MRAGLSAAAGGGVTVAGIAGLCPVWLAGLLVPGACTGGGTRAGTAGAPVSPAATRASPAAPAQATGGIGLSLLKGRIAFSAGPPHGEDVHVINADGTGRARVTTDPAADFDPAWSPDGTRIACRHQPGDDLSTGIYVISADGSAARNLTRSDGVADWGPAWSPGGRQIVWNSGRAAPGGLRGYLMAPDGSGVRPPGADVRAGVPRLVPGRDQARLHGPGP
jgi:hypothetical protein